MRYSDATIENVPNQVRKILNGHLVDTASGRSLSRGLFIYGGTGSGKTYTLYAIKNRSGSSRLDMGPVENWIELISEMRDRSLNGRVSDLLNKLTEPTIIVIDDLGGEKHTDFSEEKLYILINRIYTLGKIPILTTNLTLGQFQEKYGDRIFSRISEMCELVEFTSKDRRLEHV